MGFGKLKITACSIFYSGFSVVFLFWFCLVLGFARIFFFGWFVFSKNKLGEISVHMDVTGVDSVWTAVMQNS